MKEDLNLDVEFKDGMEKIRLVKIVQHAPSGKRVVGAMHNSRIIFLGIVSY